MIHIIIYGKEQSKQIATPKKFTFSRIIREVIYLSINLSVVVKRQVIAGYIMYLERRIHYNIIL